MEKDDQVRGYYQANGDDSVSAIFNESKGVCPGSSAILESLRSPRRRVAFFRPDALRRHFSAALLFDGTLSKLVLIPGTSRTAEVRWQSSVESEVARDSRRSCRSASRPGSLPGRTSAC